ncbi:uncharacterized protein SPSK_06594 [Sporothrix schenckii 1099-18]|uniref:Uncharacterized protein n=1 Tax=Sporothrix schenckii 1099-18 TaxID=1397361 RepID=A0A0F2MJB6_SPOSC|nr:uncharacterized protein SPSK_06594 [Sporothrix schenckii 1099-18]KJR89154.1 hypothetical protein SPSK_06594 [Sporothrix schenckii 1099-18]
MPPKSPLSPKSTMSSRYTPHPYSPSSPAGLYGVSPARKQKKKRFSCGTALYTVFCLLALATSIPIVVFAGRLLHNWPDYFHKAAGIPLAGGLIAVAADLWAVVFFAQRHRAFLVAVPLDLLSAILGAVGIFSLLQAGFNNASQPLTDAQAELATSWSADQDFGIIFSGLLCVLSCLIFSRSLRHEPTTVQAYSSTELY